MTIREAWRWLAALLMLALAVYLHSGVGLYFFPVLIFWNLIALNVGIVVRRWPALAMAAIPWPLGTGLGLVTDRYAFLGDAWYVSATLSLIAGLIGIGFGVGMARYSRGRTV